MAAYFVFYFNNLQNDHFTDKTIANMLLFLMLQHRICSFILVFHLYVITSNAIANFTKQNHKYYRYVNCFNMFKNAF